MGFRFQKRIKLGKGFGLNISKSSITPSYRNKKGSLSPKGYSLRTGIPGLSYRKTFGKAKNSGCLVLLVVVFSIPVLSVVVSCKGDIQNRNNSMNLNNNSIDFEIIKEEKDLTFQKTNIEIRLKEEVSLVQLKHIALKLKKERSSLKKLWIFYYLPEHELGNGAWATTHFKPDLKVEILGATKESRIELNSRKVTGHVIHIWKDNDAIMPSKIYLVEENKNLVIKTVYAKSSLTSSGELVEKVTQKTHNGLVQYDCKNNHGEYYIIEENGNLGLYDNSGKFKEAIKEN